ncbi:polysaccharide deacetylase family protein [Streptomyces sp. AP-93]|uniref:polysaccharide deacetylase family protein n=1 Tax=Streptomyces sp. AP-93 TaxID=2929048 RepID=UPI001FAF33E8|nr:polysaccharide deacetylase family protein [Streptomyces sp. AP-93]MCJ0868046.1 polysaccharide deacetylase family protein [Streptomyces sp. AP-93]
MRAPYKHNQRITAVVAAAGAVALITGAIVFGLAGEEAVAEPDSAPNQQVGAPAPLQVGSALTRAAEDGGKVVNLTLDDGPDPRWTPKALGLLEAHGAKATFCLTGPNAKKHPDLVKEIMDAKRMIDEASGSSRIWYYRAPGGAFTPESREIAARGGMANLGWNVDPGDFNRPGADEIVSAVQEQLKTKGPTILMHDGGGERSQSVEALEKLLPWLKEQGYDFSFPKIPEAG